MYLHPDHSIHLVAFLRLEGVNRFGHHPGVAVEPTFRR